MHVTGGDRMTEVSTLLRAGSVLRPLLFQGDHQAISSAWSPGRGAGFTAWTEAPGFERNLGRGWTTFWRLELACGGRASRRYCHIISRSPSTYDMDNKMKPIEAPRAMLVYASLGILIWLALGIADLISGAVTWRLIAYGLMTVASLYMFIRAWRSIGRRARPDS